VLCQLILDIRRILVQPELPNHVKLSAIQTAVDELAPPPGPLPLDTPGGGAYRSGHAASGPGCPTAVMSPLASDWRRVRSRRVEGRPGLPRNGNPGRSSLSRARG
jgi:hypothetical protein